MAMLELTGRRLHPRDGFPSTLSVLKFPLRRSSAGDSRLGRDAHAPAADRALTIHRRNARFYTFCSYGVTPTFP
ncbi:hypothetical protein DPMN_075272 [Dreissena polymorpha]|uniref:Uncharacterized protein n=1 Tax=Dreissena polymorpha TaxID=45954 RepID=A0A9D3YGH3_DREPO|nr:hypothetical protein DPMN_075272 [Dreissena polymorpha]